MKPLNLIATTLMATATLMASQTQAHRAWILPDMASFSGDKPVATFDASVSNEVFNFDHFALDPSIFRVTAPDGSDVKVENAAKLRYRGVFDVTLKQEGTYRVFTASEGMRAMWRDADGNRQMYPGRGQPFVQAEFDQRVPTEADGLKVSQYSRRMETFVTNGMPSDNAMEITGRGFEMQPLTHPTDLYNGESASFRFLMNGKPVEGADVTLVREDSRYRNDQNAINVSSDASGKVTVEWHGAGRYFLEAEYEDNQATPPATVRTGTYSAVLEVLPE